MHGESRDSSTFTQIGPQINQAPPLPAEAFRPWAELTVPPGLGNLPARPGLFVGRAGELARLDAALAGPGGVVVQAVHGLGGIGKSTLAAHWAAAHASDYTLTWWITAATPADIDAGLAALAVALQPALSGVLPLEALREGAVQWLAAHQGWLLILDNVTDPADVAPLLARAPAGRYLITSRRATGWYATAAPVRLDVLDPAEAEALLTAILTRDRPREVDGAAELCAELGFLPLAIEQAGAYIAEAGTTPREYLDAAGQLPGRHVPGQPPRAATPPAPSPGSGDVTLDRLAGDPLAGQVLRILAWYAPDGDPPQPAGGLADPPALLGAVGRLAAYSMLTVDRRHPRHAPAGAGRDPHPRPGDPHRNAPRPSTTPATRPPASSPPPFPVPAGPGRMASVADAAPAHRCPGQPRASRTGRHRNHRLAAQPGRAVPRQPGPGRPRGLAYFRAGPRRHSRGSWARTTPTPWPPASNLATDYQVAGDLGRAIPLYEQALADSMRVLGEDHPHTLTSRSNLAGAYQEAGDLGRAIPLFEQTLADSVRVLGEDHPDTLASRNNLAGAYQAAGDLGRAIPLFEQALADQRAGPGRRPPRDPGLPPQPRRRLPCAG